MRLLHKTAGVGEYGNFTATTLYRPPLPLHGVINTTLITTEWGHQTTKFESRAPPSPKSVYPDRDVARRDAKVLAWCKQIIHKSGLSMFYSWDSRRVFVGVSSTWVAGCWGPYAKKKHEPHTFVGSWFFSLISV